MFLLASSQWLLGEEKRIVFLGDSLTAGYLLSPEEAFPFLIGERLKDEGVPNKVINAGVSGDTSAGGLRRIDWLLKEPIDVLVLALGANDALRGLDPEVTETNLSKLIAKVISRYPKAKIILTGMLAPPNMGSDYADAFNAIYPRIADKFLFEFYPFLLDEIAGQARFNLPDGIHPNVAGHKIIAKQLYPIVKAAAETSTRVEKEEEDKS